MRIQDGNCACTCDGINEEARTRCDSPEQLLGLNKIRIYIDVAPRIISTSGVSNLPSNRNSTDNGSLEAPMT